MKSWWELIFGARKSELAASPDGAVREQIGLLRDYIRRDVAAGFYDDDVVLTNAVAAFEEELDGTVLRREARRLLREMLAEHAEAERNWPSRTDCDRLDDAFAALEANGVISRQNFTCCGTCGSAEIWDEMKAVEEAGGPVRGYAFYHMQDTESAADGHGIFPNYGACEEGEEAALAIGRDIVTQLEAQGLNCDWNGDWGKRIAVGLDWKRRR